MEALVEVLQDVVTAEPKTDVQSDLVAPDCTTAEPELAQLIISLWSDHVRLSGDRRATSKELRQIRARLAERLYEMKSLLSHPGRGGQWRSWLKDRGIPRSSADRLVLRHGEVSENRAEENVLNGAITASLDEAADKVAKSVWLRHGKNLVTNEAVVRFLADIAKLAGVAHEWRDEGLVILCISPGPGDAAAGAEVTIESLSLDGTPALVAEPQKSVHAGQGVVTGGGYVV